MGEFVPDLAKPITTTSYEGYIFEPNSTAWKISHEHKLGLRWVGELLEFALAGSFIKILEHYAKKYSASHTKNLCSRFQHFALNRYENSKQRLEKITAADLIGYRSILNREHEWYLGALRGFLKTWMEFGCPGIDDDVYDLLGTWRIGSNVKGRAVQTLCPIEGPLSEIEFAALHQQLIFEFEKDAISLEDLALLQIFMATGRRPMQLADLKVKDFVLVQAQNGLQEYLLNVPRRKQRGIGWRQEFKLFALSSDIGLMINDLIEQSRVQLSSLCHSLPNFDAFPLFPKWNKINRLIGETHDHIEAVLNSPELHRTTEDLRSRMDIIVSRLNILSERTGKPLRVFPTRLRRTLATRAAREGFGELIIAELLDHTDTQNARVYTENVPEHVDAINKAVAQQLAPLAQAFAGIVVTKEGDAIRGNDLTSRVRCESGSVGTCGHHGFCGALAPIACYTCRHFQPWQDGPHDVVLNSLLAERDRILEITRDQVMAAVNDRTILAVTQVIQICEQRRVASTEEVNG